MSTSKQGRATLTNALLAAFCRDTSMLLDSNIPLHLGYGDIYASMPDNAPLRVAATTVCAALEQKGRLSDALVDSGLFPAHLCDTARIGEQSGRLDDTMRELSVYYDRLDNFQTRLKNAVLYPVLLIAMMTTVVGVLIWSVLPVFEKVLGRFNQSASADAGAVMRGSMVVCTVIFALLLLLLVLAVTGLLMSRTVSGSQTLARLFERIPLTQRLGYDIAASHFAAGLSAMLQSGFSTEESLRALLPTVSHVALRGRVQDAYDALERGEPQDKALIDANIFGQADNHLIAVSARTGAMDTCATQISARYDGLVGDSLDRVIAVAEPALIACLTIVIGAVMLSVMLPLIRVMDSIG